MPDKYLLHKDHRMHLRIDFPCEEVHQKQIAAVMRTRRERFGLSRVQLSRAVGIRARHLARCETGKTKYTASEFARMCCVLHLSVWDFVPSLQLSNTPARQES